MSKPIQDAAVTPFHALPHGQRMAYRKAIEDAGGEVVSYQGECVLVAVPRAAGGQSADDFPDALERAGLLYVRGSAYLFPLGSDNPPDRLRHDGDYPGSRGFWLYGLFRPVAVKARSE